MVSGRSSKKSKQRWGLLHTNYCIKLKPVLVDVSEFPSVLSKIQHSHSRNQKRTSNLLRITRGSYVHKPIEKLSGTSQFFFFFLQIPQNIDILRQNNSQGLRIHQNSIIILNPFHYFPKLYFGFKICQSLSWNCRWH